MSRRAREPSLVEAEDRRTLVCSLEMSRSWARMARTTGPARWVFAYRANAARSRRSLRCSPGAACSSASLIVVSLAFAAAIGPATIAHAASTAVTRPTVERLDNEDSFADDGPGTGVLPIRGRSQASIAREIASSTAAVVRACSPVASRSSIARGAPPARACAGPRPRRVALLHGLGLGEQDEPVAHGLAGETAPDAVGRDQRTGVALGPQHEQPPMLGRGKPGPHPVRDRSQVGRPARPELVDEAVLILACAREQRPHEVVLAAEQEQQHARVPRGGEHAPAPAPAPIRRADPPTRPSLGISDGSSWPTGSSTPRSSAGTPTRGDSGSATGSSTPHCSARGPPDTSAYVCGPTTRSWRRGGSTSRPDSRSLPRRSTPSFGAQLTGQVYERDLAA